MDYFSVYLGSSRLEPEYPSAKSIPETIDFFSSIVVLCSSECDENLKTASESSKNLIAKRPVDKAFPATVTFAFN